MKDKFQFRISKTKVQNPKSEEIDLLSKLESVEEFYLSQNPKESKQKKQKPRKNSDFYSDLSYFKALEDQFPQFHIQVRNLIKTNSIRTYSAYFEIFSTYTETLLNLIKRGSLEKSARCHLFCEQEGNRLIFSLQVDGLRFAKVDQINHDLNRTNKNTSHLLTPFDGKIKSYIKKTKGRNVSAILVKMNLTPLRQHLPQNRFTIS